jgi:hypothetical protein
MTPTFVWTVHALERLHERGLTRETVERTVRESHAARQTNTGAADWRIDAGSFFVLYDHPVGNDMDVARIITVWPKRRKRRQHLKLVSDENEDYSER